MKKPSTHSAQKSAPSGTLVIGITGGMASGKSTVAAMFNAPGIRHFNADACVHDLLQHDRSIAAAIAAAFPRAINAKTTTIDRAALAAIVSKKPKALATLEAILHPAVRKAEQAAIRAAKKAKAPAIILDIPLLFETDAHTLCDVTLVVHAPKALRRKRAFARPGMTEEKWERLITRQLPDAARKSRADIVIPSHCSKAETRRHVRALMKELGLS
jgi:dephospho-CoA kinase